MHNSINQNSPIAINVFSRKKFCVKLERYYILHFFLLFRKSVHDRKPQLDRKLPKERNDVNLALAKFVTSQQSPFLKQAD